MDNTPGVAGRSKLLRKGCRIFDSQPMNIGTYLKGDPVGAANKIVQEAIERMDEGQRALVLTWAQKAQEISERSDLTKREKLHQLKDLDTTPAVKAFVIVLGTALKQQLWDERSWPARGGLSGLALGAMVLGGQGAGIAAMGGAIGVPLFILTAAGGALLGTIVAELKGAASKRNNGNE